MADLDTTVVARETSSLRQIRALIKTEETKEIVAFILTQFVSFFVFRAITQIYPLYLQRTTTLTEKEVAIKWGLIVSAYTFGGIFTRVPMGILIEKLGRKIITVISYLLMILATVGLAFSTATWYLALAFILLRTSANSFGLGGRSLISDMETKNKGLYNALISTFARIGGLVGIVALGVIIEFLPPYVMLLFPAVLALLGLVFFVLFFYEGSGERRYKLRKKEQIHGNKVSLTIKDFVTKSFLFFFLIFTTFGIAEGITGPVVSLYGKNILNLSESHVGTIIGLAQVGYIATSPFIGVIISKNQKYLFILPTISVILWIGDYLLMFFLPLSTSAFIAFLVVRNLIQAMFWTSALTILTTELAKDKFALMYSILTTTFFAGISIGSLFSGAIFAKDYRLTWLYSMWAAIALFILLLGYFLIQQKHGGKKLDQSFLGFK